MMVEFVEKPANPRFIDLTGRIFGRWHVEGYLGKRKRQAMWHCVCECGREKAVNGNNLKSGRSQSCSCIRVEFLIDTFTKHNHANVGDYTPEYWAYSSAKQRCTNPNHKSYDDYGGRGIEFRFSCFEEFFEELGHRPAPTLTVDRINNELHYMKGNLRWATRKEQRANQRTPV